jgi:hypothetical protein
MLGHNTQARIINDALIKDWDNLFAMLVTRKVVHYLSRDMSQTTTIYLPQNDRNLFFHSSRDWKNFYLKLKM